jgi:prophage tail gpP-like protein
MADPVPLPKPRPKEAPQAKVPLPKPRPDEAPKRLTDSRTGRLVKEIATLEVRGSLFTNWTSVRVEQRVTEPYPVFQFECSEQSPLPVKFDDALKFVPGDIVRVYVGGVSAVFGYILERHVAYDAKQHSVRLIGIGDTYDLATSMVPLDKLNGHDGKNWMQLAKDLAAHLGIAIIPKGAVDNTPFENIQVQPGETIMAVLERYARMRSIVIGSNANGGLLAIGDHTALTDGALTEGNNILRANCVVRDNVYNKYFTVGQGTGSDLAYGDAQNKQVAMLPGTSLRNRHSITVADIADLYHGIIRRVNMEHVFVEGAVIEANIVVQGWFKDNNRSDDVWKAGEFYHVSSPSLILDRTLGCSSCVYEQSDAGTTTTLTMVDPEHMQGHPSFRAEAAAFEKLQRAEADARRWLNEKLKLYEP